MQTFSKRAGASPRSAADIYVGLIMAKKVALISGITGQDGSYLAELLLEKGYEVHGIKRRSSSFNSERIDHLYRDPHLPNTRFFLHYGDLTDATNLIRIIQEVQPTEIYNLAAQSHVQVSFETPEYTANADALGTLRLLEGIRILGLKDRIRFYQASTSELYGKVQEITANRNRPPFIRVVHMLRQSFMPIGSLSIIAKRTDFMLQMASYSIMRGLGVAKRL